MDYPKFHEQGCGHPECEAGYRVAEAIINLSALFATGDAGNIDIEADLMEQLGVDPDSENATAVIVTGIIAALAHIVAISSREGHHRAVVEKVIEALWSHPMIVESLENGSPDGLLEGKSSIPSHLRDNEQYDADTVRELLDFDVDAFLDGKDE